MNGDKKREENRISNRRMAADSSAERRDAGNGTGEEQAAENRLAEDPSAADRLAEDRNAEDPSAAGRMAADRNAEDPSAAGRMAADWNLEDPNAAELIAEDRSGANRIGVESGSVLFVYRQTSPESYFHHAHRGIEMLYIYEGHGEIMVDNRTYPMAGDSLVWFQPYQLHRVAVPSAPNRSYVRSNLTFDPPFLERYLSPFPALERFYRHLWQGNLREQFAPSVRDTPIRELLDRLHRIAVEPSPAREEDMGLLLATLVRELRGVFADEAAAVADSPSRTRSHADRIAEWVDDHYKRPFKLEELADSLHLSPYHVSHVFKKAAGITLSEYVIRRRVREACALLANTSLSVQEIAAELGGLSPSYFCQMFKRAKGLSPEQYRRSIR